MTGVENWLVEEKISPFAARKMGHPATAVLHAVADLPLVNIQADVIHRLHGGASLVFLNQLAG